MKKKTVLSLLIVLSMVMSLLPAGAVTVSAAEALSIISVKFRANTKSYYAFDETVPYNMLWVEFSNRVDHAAAYDDESKTYNLDGDYYQLEISRPEHGPSESPHPAATMIPDNGVAGSVRDEFADGGDNKKHRYHGWQIGTKDLFDKDETTDYQIGDYTVNLNKLTVTSSATPSPDELKAFANKTTVDSETIKILEVTYQLSEKDKSDGYKLTVPEDVGTVENDGKTAKILAMVDDWVINASPGLDQSSATVKDKNMTIAGWKLVKGGGAETKIGDKIPDDTDDGNKDNKITLEAVLEETKTYTYDFTLNDDKKESVVPTAPPASSEVPKPTKPPASYNELISGPDETAKPIEYEPTATLEPLTLRLVNTGNQRICLSVFSQNNLFTVSTEDVNKDDEEAKKTYDEGGLESGKKFWYIPSEKDCVEPNGENWKNYAEVVITPRAGLGAGEHTGMISVMPINGPRIMTSFSITIKVDQKEVKIVPESTTKPYGKELTQADILCDVFDKDNNSLLEDNKTAAELGITIQSKGMEKDATVKDGPYEYKLAEVASTGNYKVTLKEDKPTNITVEKATPVIKSEPQVTTKGGMKLSALPLTGTYVNQDSQETVDGDFEWLEQDFTVPSDEKKTIQKEYKFTPEDKDNYNTVESALANIIITPKKATNLRAYPAYLNRTYNGEGQAPRYTWDRSDTIRTELLKVTYKKVEPGDIAFNEDEDFTVEGGYTETVPKDAGTYKVHATYKEDNTYAEGLANEIMTINPLELNMNLSSAVKNKNYDGTTAAEVDPARVTFNNKPKADDDVRVKASAFTASFRSVNSDEYYRQSVDVVVTDPNALEGEDAANYTLKTGSMHTLAYIYQRPIRLELKKTIEKHYGETYAFTSEDYQAAADQPENGGLAENDTVNMLRAMVTAKKDGVDGASEKAEVGDYTVTAATPIASGYNYEITSDALGTLKVVQTTPKAISINSDNGVVGQTLQSLVDEHFSGTFKNPYNYEDVEGTLAWKNPDEQLTKEKSEYEYIFTPTDQKNYTTLEGTITMTVSDKPVAKIKQWTVPENPVYNGYAHSATLVPESSTAQTKVEYKKTDIEPHNAEAQNTSDDWTEIPPINAGTYLVRGTVFAYDNFADNTVDGTLTILQATPQGTVTASSVDKGAHLSDSVLTHTFTGINGDPVEGDVIWERQGVSSAGDIIVDPNEEYEWIFVPKGDDAINYKTVTGKTKVAINIDTRAAEAEIYNLPTNYDQIGDYAYVNVDGKNVKAGDTITFYKDAEMLNPESEPFVITEEMSGWTKINIDDDALNTEKGTLYVNIEGSTTVTPVEYKAEVGFMVSPTLLYMKANDPGETLTIGKSDDEYTVNNSTWTAETEGIVTIEKAQDNMSATVTGEEDGSTRIIVTVEFAHPDPRETGKTVTITSYALATVTEDDPPTYEYTTKDATDVTATGATLNGHIDINTYGDSITPHAVGLFKLWEKGQTEADAVTYGMDNPIILNESGDYSITVDGLKSNTVYVYKAVGIDGDQVTNGDETEFTTGKAQYTVTFKNEHGAKITADGVLLGEDLSVTKSEGEKLTFTVEAPEGMHLLNVFANGTELTPNDNGEYTVTVDTNYEITFVYENLSGIDVSSFTVDGDGVASATVTNNSGASVKILLISVAYDQIGKIVSSAVKAVDLTAGANEERIATDPLEDIAQSIKAYLWDGDTYQPYVDAAEPTK